MLRSAALRVSRRVQGLALAPQRGFADKAVAQALNWDDIGSMVHSDEGRRELQALRSTYLDIQQRLTNLAKDGEGVNWANWRQEIDPKLVDSFKSAFESMQLPKYQGTEVADAQAKFAALISEAEGLVAHSAARSKEIEAEIQGMQAEKARIATVTVDEELAADPKLAAELDDDVAKSHFLVV